MVPGLRVGRDSSDWTSKQLRFAVGEVGKLPRARASRALLSQPPSSAELSSDSGASVSAVSLTSVYRSSLLSSLASVESLSSSLASVESLSSLGHLRVGGGFVTWSLSSQTGVPGSAGQCFIGWVGNIGFSRCRLARIQVPQGSPSSWPLVCPSPSESR